MRRVVQLVPVLFGLSVVVLAWVRALPGDPSAALLASGNGTADPAVTREAAAEVRRLYGLDRPLYKRYVSWVGRTVRLDFGQSITTRQDVSSELGRRFPATVELTLATLVLTVGLGIPLGFASARRAHGWFDHLSLGARLVGVSIPIFFLAFVLKSSSP